MGVDQTILDCSNTLNGRGDNTAGPVWRAANVGDTPIGGFSKVTNYPNGESLSSPVDAVVIGQSVILWTTAKIAGPVCGYNIANVLGYMSAALVMFGFIYSLTKRKRWIALIAGYAVAFTPYFQVKIGVHPSYGFQALLIGVVWAFFSLVTTRKKSRAFLLAILIAICFYFDPYFSLLALTIVIPLGLVWLFVGLIKPRKEKSLKLLFIAELKLILLSVGLLILLLLPLVYIMATQSSQINSAMVGSRGNIIEQAKTYSNMPNEYFLPFAGSPIFRVFGSLEKKIHDSLYIFSNGGISEDTVGISLIMMFIVTLFLVIVIWEKIRHKRLGLNKLLKYDAHIVLFGSLAVTFTAVIMALPPVHILGVPLPSLILVSITNTWRAISREYVVVNIAMTVLFIIALTYFNHALKLKRVTKVIIYTIIFLFILVQYQTYHPFQGFELSKFSYSNSPVGYFWLKEQKNIKAIAEYPIEKASEASSHGYYLTMQLVHKKPILNSAITNSPGDSTTSSNKNLADPQTVPVLHSLGIDAIVVHGVDPVEIEKIPYLAVVYQGNHGVGAGFPGSPAITKDIFVIARIAGNTPAPNGSIQFIDKLPRNSVIQKSATDWQYEIPTKSRIVYRQLPVEKSLNVPNQTNVGEICFMVKMAGLGDNAQLAMKNNKQVISDISIDDQYKSVRFAVGVNDEIKLISSNGHNMRITKIGCSS